MAPGKSANDRQSEAELKKSKGNEALKAGQLPLAIACYTMAISVTWQWISPMPWVQGLTTLGDQALRRGRTEAKRPGSQLSKGAFFFGFHRFRRVATLLRRQSTPPIAPQPLRNCGGVNFAFNL